MKTFKNILLWLVTTVIWCCLTILLAIGTTAWFWVPFTFALNDLSGLLGFIIGMVVTSATYYIYNRITN